MKKFLIILTLFGCAKKNDVAPTSEIETVTIGTQVFMAKNLDVETYSNGDPIQYVNSAKSAFNPMGNGEKGAYCRYNFNPSETKLYNWYAVVDPRGICPKGFHVPTSSEWRTLYNYLGATTISGMRGAYRGVSGQLKDKSWGYTATNRSGFTALPTGLLRFYYPVEFDGKGIYTFYWGFDNGYSFQLKQEDDILYEFNSDKYNMYCVRCLKD